MDLNDPKELSRFLSILGTLVSIAHGVGLIIWGSGVILGWGLIVLGVLGIIIAVTLLLVIFEKIPAVPFIPIVQLVFAILLLTTAWIGGIIVLIGAIIIIYDDIIK